MAAVAHAAAVSAGIPGLPPLGHQFYGHQPMAQPFANGLSLGGGLPPGALAVQQPIHSAAAAAMATGVSGAPLTAPLAAVSIGAPRQQFAGAGGAAAPAPAVAAFPASAALAPPAQQSSPGKQPSSGGRPNGWASLGAPPISGHQPH